ncbi:alpha/beta fold hydrolase [Mesorhizobium sp. M0767]|uniref:alpha/beta hydrolase n=1 Tax=Mesorhizobium sp. M0767 TaxID=2956995 RepID=UPI0033398CE0
MFKTLTLAVATTAALAASNAVAAPRVERVTFSSHGEQLVGELYLPEDLDAAKPRPALVVTGAWMTVKEQMPGRYAREMADRGFVALTFDFRGWGESGGRRRQYEDPSAKIADIEAAVAYLASRPETDKDRIGGLGICASSGYMVTAAAGNAAIKSVALVAPWLQDAEVVEQTYGGRNGVFRLEAVGDAAKAEYRRTGKQAFLPAASLTDERAIMFKVPYYTEPDRGMIPAWRNEADPAFWRGWLTFDAIQAAPRLHQPFLMVHSEAAAIPKGAHKFYTRLTSSKRELWLDNVTQFDFYDRAAPVKAASDAAAAHFRATLGSAGEAGQ